MGKNVTRILILGCCSCVFCLNSSPGFSQINDTTDVKKERKGFFNNIFSKAKEAITISSKDSIARSSVLNSKSETPFLPYEGKVIRNIMIRKLGFEKTFADTSNNIIYWGTKVLNSLHKDSREWVIRENLFIKEQTLLNPYKLADNERFLRSLDFIQDARILVSRIPGNADSVDLLVITKDLFSITGSVEFSGVNRVKAKIAETNLLGMGQKVQFSLLVDKGRRPKVGYDMAYIKNSIARTFINGSVGYTLINTGRSEGTEEERAFFVRLERPLVSPYFHFAGGFELSFNHSENVYEKSDSLYYKYQYHVRDTWIGYNFGIGKGKSYQDRSRKFIAVRYLRNKFREKPWQIGENFDPIYNDKEGFLAEFTFFKQNYYNTNYIYGFGTTEDVPYGYNVSLTGGWYKQLDLERPYAGISANRFIATPKGHFIQYFIKGGTFLNKSKLQDASIMLGGSIFNKLLLLRNLKIREYLKLSYTRLFSRVTYDPLRVDNPFGLRYFRSDSALANERLSLYTETLMFTKHKLFGFKLAPFVFADISYLTPEERSYLTKGIYSGLGGGLRVRNENLVFGTMELRVVYFPRLIEGTNSFKIVFKSNLRFRYNSNYVKAPGLVQLNSDESVGGF